MKKRKREVKKVEKELEIKKVVKTEKETYHEPLLSKHEPLQDITAKMSEVPKSPFD